MTTPQIHRVGLQARSDSSSQLGTHLRDPPKSRAGVSVLASSSCTLHGTPRSRFMAYPVPPASIALALALSGRRRRSLSHKDCSSPPEHDLVRKTGPTEVAPRSSRKMRRRPHEARLRHRWQEPSRPGSGKAWPGVLVHGVEPRWNRPHLAYRLQADSLLSFSTSPGHPPKPMALAGPVRWTLVDYANSAYPAETIAGARNMAAFVLARPSV